MFEPLSLVCVMVHSWVADPGTPVTEIWSQTAEFAPEVDDWTITHDTLPPLLVRVIDAEPPVAEQREMFTPPFVSCTTFVAVVHDQPAPGQSAPAKLRSPRCTTTPRGSIPIERRYERTVSVDAAGDSAGAAADAGLSERRATHGQHNEDGDRR